VVLDGGEKRTGRAWLRGELRRGRVVMTNSADERVVLNGGEKRIGRAQRPAWQDKGEGEASRHPAPACDVPRRSSCMPVWGKAAKTVDGGGEQAGKVLWWHCSYLTVHLLPPFSSKSQRQLTELQR
jgi:hypothetical protein